MDGRSIGHSDLTVEDLEPGSVEVVARLTGHREARRQVRVESGQASLVALTLSPLPGTLVLKVKGPEKFLLASADESWETPRNLHLEPGEHRFLVQAPGFREKSVRARIEAGGQTTLEVTMEKAPMPSLPTATAPAVPSAPGLLPASSLPPNLSLPRLPSALPQVRLPLDSARPSIPPVKMPRAPVPRPVLTPVRPPTPPAAVLTPVPPPSTPPAAVLTPVPPPRTVPGTVPQPLLTPVNR